MFHKRNNAQKFTVRCAKVSLGAIEDLRCIGNNTLAPLLDLAQYTTHRDPRGIAVQDEHIRRNGGRVGEYRGSNEACLQGLKGLLTSFNSNGWSFSVNFVRGVARLA